MIGECCHYTTEHPPVRPFAFSVEIAVGLLGLVETLAVAARPRRYALTGWDSNPLLPVDW